MGPRVIIVGGGISGLATSFYLRTHFSGISVTLLEASDRLGGVLRTLRPSGTVFEAAADTFDGKDTAAADLCRETGLGADLVPCESSLAALSIRKDGRTFPVPLSPALLKSPLLDFSAKARLLFTPFIPRGRPDPAGSLADFVCRRFGRSFFKQVAEPLVRGVAMAAPEDLLAAGYFPSAGRRADRRSVFCVKGGMDRLVNALAKRMERVDVRLSAAVRSVGCDKPWRVMLESGEALEAEAVCLALPAPLAIGLTGLAGPRLAEQLSGFRYDPAAVVNMLFRPEEVPGEWRRPGFVVPGPGERWPFACLKSAGPDETGRYIRMKAFISGVLQPEVFSLPGAAAERAVINQVKEEWRVPAPRWSAFTRYPGSIAQRRFGPPGLISRAEPSLPGFPGLFLAGSAVGEFGITDCVRSAGQTAERIARALL